MEQEMINRFNDSIKETAQRFGVDEALIRLAVEAKLRQCNDPLGVPAMKKLQMLEFITVALNDKIAGGISKKTAKESAEAYLNNVINKRPRCFLD